MRQVLVESKKFDEESVKSVVELVTTTILHNGMFSEFEEPHIELARHGTPVYSNCKLHFQHKIDWKIC